jgi:RecA DNA recombination protein
MSSSVKLADLEALLRTKHLDGTLTSTAAEPPSHAVAPVGISGIDAQLRGGFPRGQLSELVGARSSGRTTVLHALLAAATSRGEFVALVDSLDTFDPASAANVGVALERLLWVRGPSITQSPVSGNGELFPRGCERAIKAFNLILQAAGSRTAVLAVLDLADMPASVLRRMPFITWLRLQRVLEGSEGVGLLVADASLGRSARGRTLQLTSTPPTSYPAQTSPWQLPPFELSAFSSQSRALTPLSQ